MATIQKRSNGYFISVSCGYDNTGKQIRRTMTYRPEEGMTAKQIEKEVKRQAVLFEEQCHKGTVAVDNRLKFADYIPMYLENAKNTLSPVVYEQYNRIFNIYVIPMLGHFKLKDIKPLHVQKFVNALENLEERTDGTPCKLSPSTVRRYYTALQSVLHSAYKLGIIGINPADSDRITLPKLDEQETDIFSTEDLNNMLACLDDEPLQFQLLIHLALNTGCRRGELTGLKWSDIDYTTGIITVSRSNYKLTGDPEIKSKSTKTGKSRKVMIPPYCIDMLRKYKTQQAKLQLSLGDRWNGDNWIFIQADGKPMYPTTPTLQFTKFLKRNDLPHMKFHALRHTSATLLLSNGTNIKNVAARLGHAQLKTTNRYVHAIEEAEKEAANTLEAVLNTNRKKA